MFSKKFISTLVQKCFDIGKGDRIYFAGNYYIRDLLDGILVEMFNRGAEVISTFWSDNELLVEILTTSPEVAASLWIPEPARGGAVKIHRMGRVMIDKIVTLFSSPFESSLKNVHGRLNVKKGVVEEKLKDFRLKGSDNLHKLVRKGAQIVLLDFPSRFRIENEGMDEKKVYSVYKKALLIDNNELKKFNNRIVSYFKGKKKVKITCPRGTDFGFELGKWKWGRETCSLKNENMVQLPGGEVYVPPITKTGNGRIVSLRGGTEHHVLFEDGVAKMMLAKKKSRFSSVSHHLVNGSESFCEFGIGTNWHAKPLPLGPIYEKAFGTVHIGIGDNSFFGGPIKSNVHGDFIIEKPTVVVDGESFMKNGRLKI